MRLIDRSLVLALLFLVACGSDAPPAVVDIVDVSAESSTVDSSETVDSTTPGDSGTATDTATGTDTAMSEVTTDAAMACMGSPDAGAKCNELTNVGADVTLVITAMAIPTGTGGAISDGRYTLTEFKSYLGSLLPAGQTLKQTLELCGGAGQLVTNDKGKPEVHKSYTIKPAGTAPNLKQTCSTQMPDVEIPYASYTATTTTVTFYSTMYAFSATYTKK